MPQLLNISLVQEVAAQEEERRGRDAARGMAPAMARKRDCGDLSCFVLLQSEEVGVMCSYVCDVSDVMLCGLCCKFFDAGSLVNAFGIGIQVVE